MRPKRYEREIGSLHCELGGTDCSSQLDQNIRRETENLQSHLDDTEIPIGETEVTRVSSSGYVKWTRWRRMDQIAGAEFDFWFGTYVDMRKWLKVFGAYH